jgi:hypothetical protein
MSKIISERKTVEEIYYRLDFEYPNEKGCGFSFPCDKDGNLSDDMQQAAIDNYNWCIANPDKINNLGVQKHINRYRQPAILLCDCGEKIELYGNTNTCDKCEADYNMFGQKLAPRSQWGYETGESWCDCY